MQDRLNALIAQCDKTEKAMQDAIHAWEDAIIAIKKAANANYGLVEGEKNEEFRVNCKAHA